MIFIILGIIIPIMFVIYNIYCFKTKKIVYMINSNTLTVSDNGYYKWQLILGLINSVLLTLNCYIWQTKEFQFGAVIYIATFWLINYLIKGESLSHRYLIEEKPKNE